MTVVTWHEECSTTLAAAHAQLKPQEHADTVRAGITGSKSALLPSERKKQWEAKKTLRLTSNPPPLSASDSLPQWAHEDLRRAQRARADSGGAGSGEKDVASPVLHAASVSALPSAPAHQLSPRGGQALEKQQGGGAALTVGAAEGSCCELPRAAVARVVVM